MILSIVSQAWQSLGDPPPGLVVAVSGGPDSVALVRALLAVRAGRPIPIVLAHLNHQLRGGDSDADEAFVDHLHARLIATEETHLSLVCQRLDMAQLAAEAGGNLEALARRERYRFLAETARRHALHHVATGHTASDQAETVLHRLFRGTGLDGLRGIAFRRELETGVSVVRPLLSVTRTHVLAYLEDRGQAFRQDRSNDDVHFTRNRIRHELLPLLAREYNPRIVEALNQLAEQAAEVLAEEDVSAGEWLQKAELPRAGAMVILDVVRLRAASPRLLRGVLRKVWQREGWPMGEMGFAHWRRAAELVRAEGGAHDLPGGVHARRRGRVLQLFSRGSQNRARGGEVPPLPLV